jgi:hypothetical protein
MMTQLRDKERIRQALEAALAGLDAPAETASRSGAGKGAPVIIVVGDVHSREQTGADQSKQSIGEANPHAGPTSSHPGLQRFANLETESPSPAFRSCFMEPERECVHSGACEMRGY